MRFLVTGVKGQLGYDVVKELKSRGFDDILEYDVDVMDITNEKQVYNCIVGGEPDVVIHCAAYTAVDKAEDDFRMANKVNVNGTKLIAEYSKKVGAKLIYISTDYVFDGNKPLGETYDVNDSVDPINKYGLTKYYGEEMAKLNPKHFIVRTSWVFGINGNNFIKTMLRLANERDEISVVGDQYGSPTYTVDLARLLVDMSLTDKYGIYHANNEGYTSWYLFAKKIFEINNIDIKLNNINTEDYKTRAKRPHNSCLDKSCLDNNGFDRLPLWEDAVERYSDELNKEKNKQKILKK